MIPSLRVMQAQKKEKEKEVFVAERCEDLEGLDKKRKEAQKCGHKHKQKMIETYGGMTKERVFVEGELVLKTTDHVRRSMARPSKFSPKWKRPFVVREAHASGYYRLDQMNGKDLVDPIIGK